MGKRIEGVEESGRKEQRKRETNILELCGSYGGLRRYVFGRRGRKKERRYVELDGEVKLP